MEITKNNIGKIIYINNAKSIGHISSNIHPNILISFSNKNVTADYIPKTNDIVYFDLLGSSVAINVNSLTKHKINEESIKKTGILILNNCGLIDWPDELFRLTHLKTLILGNYYNKINYSTNYFEIDKYLIPVKNSNNSLRYISPKINKLNNLTHLCLERNNISIIRNLDGLNKLISLELGGNSIDKIENLNNLSSLELLFLYSNNIKKIEGLESLKNIKKIFLGGNSIQKLEGLNKCVNLNELYLHNNDINTIEDLPEFNSLETLELRSNKISSIKGIILLKNLKYLSVDNNDITIIEGVNKMNKLQRLHLENNKISKIENLNELKSLLLLHLEGNQIQAIEGLEKLGQLEELDLSNNKIKKIDGLSNLRLLKKLYLNNNCIQSIGNLLPILKNPLIVDLNIKNNPFTLESSWLTQETLSAIGENRVNLLKYFQDHNSNKLKFKLPSKIILLGNSEDGKSTFAQKLVPNSKIIKRSTHGLNIIKWKSKNKSNAIIYDFGGQDYYHSIYNMYFSWNTLYIILWDSNRNVSHLASKSKITNLELSSMKKYIAYDVNYWIGNYNYWIKRQKLFNNIPEIESYNILISIQNFFNGNVAAKFIDNQISGINYQFSLNLNFKNNNNINALRFQLLKETVSHEIEKINNVSISISKDDYEIYLNIINDVENNFFTLKQFKTKYPEARTYLLDILHQKGIILHFSKSDKLKNYIWTNPSLLSKKINSILSKKNIGSGKIQNKLFKCEAEMVELLLDQEIIFNDPTSSEYVIPQYLPMSNPDDPLLNLALSDITDGFHIKFFDYIPHGLMARISCRLGSTPGHKYFYRDLIVFSIPLIENEIAKVMIRVNFITLTFEIKASVNKLHKTNLFRFLFHNILLAYWNYDFISYDDYYDKSSLFIDLLASDTVVSNVRKKWIPKLKDLTSMNLFLSFDGIHFIEYNKEFSNINIQISKNKQFIKASNLGDINSNIFVPIINFKPFISDEIFIPESKRLFISYSSKDSSFMNRFVTHLKALQREGVVSYWVDRMIETGTLWDEKINIELENSDMIIYLLSPDFIATDYIMEVELKKGIELSLKSNSRIKLEFIHLLPNGWKRNPLLKELQQLLDKEKINKNLVFINFPENDIMWMQEIDNIEKKLQAG